MTVEMLVPCPNCKEKAVMSEVIYEMPFFGEALITTISCANCKYKLNDVIALKENNPKIYKKIIKTKKDMFLKVIRNSNATIKIKEFGLELKPADFSEGFMTNIEGVLNKFENILLQLQKSKLAEKQKKKVLELIEKVKKAKENKIKFTIELIDKSGNSAIIKEKLK